MIKTLLPENLYEAVELMFVFFKEHKEQMKDMREDVFVSASHTTMHNLMRSAWFRSYYLKGKSNVLTNYFNNLEVYDANDMADFIARSTFRKLTGREINLNQQIHEYIRTNQTGRLDYN